MSLRRRKPKQRVDRNPLDALENEITRAIQEDTSHKPTRASTRRRHGRTVLVVSVLTLMLVAGTSGASALLLGTTGVPAIDRFLNARQAKRSDEEPPQSMTASEQPHPGLPGMDLRPKSRNASEPIEVALDRAGLRKTRLVTYLSMSNDVCLASALVLKPNAKQLQRSNLGCQSLAGVTEELADAPAYVIRLVPSVPLVIGLTTADIRYLKVSGPGGPFSVRMGSPWTPDVPDAKPIRTFIASRPRTFLDFLSSKTPPGSGDLGRYGITATTEDGTTVRRGPIR